MTFIRKLDRSEVRFLLITEEEIEAPDKDFDPECLEVIRKRVENGDLWGWCTALVKVYWLKAPNLATGEATLVACSYESAEDFKENSGYYGGMCDEALEDLQKNLDGYAKLLEPLVTIQSFETWLVEKTHEE